MGFDVRTTDMTSLMTHVATETCDDDVRCGDSAVPGIEQPHNLRYSAVRNVTAADMVRLQNTSADVVTSQKGKGHQIR
jgi:hypothetical protein